MRPLKLLLVLGSVASCGGEPPALEVGGVAFTESELLGLTPARREGLADLAAFGAAVSARNLDRLGDPLVQQQLARRMADLLRARRALDSLDVGDEHLDAYYLGNPQFELSVRHLIVMSPRYESASTRDEARAKATRALERIQAGEPFPEVAAEVSEEPGAEGRQGLLEPGRKGAWVGEFWDAASALQAGDVSPVVETTYGFHVLRLEGRTLVPFEEVSSQVMLDVAAQLGVRPSADPPVPPPAELNIPPAEELLALVEDRSVADEEPVAAWQGGWLTAGELRYRLAALDRPAYDAIQSGSVPGALTAETELAVRWKITLDEARTLGLTPGIPYEAELRRAWTDTVTQWAGALGLRANMKPDALKEATLQAFENPGQNATLVRTEVEARAPLLRLAYPRARSAGG